MACAPHLSFLVVVLVLIIAWIFVPRVRCRGMFVVCVMFGGVWCGGCRWGIADQGGGGGNNEWACCKASLMVLGACLYVVRNSSGVNIAKIALFWICGSVVIPYMYSLSRYCWDLAFMSVVRLA